MGTQAGNAAIAVEDVEISSEARLETRETGGAGPDNDGQLARAVSRVGSRLGALSVNIADTSGTVGDVARGDEAS